MVSALCTHTCSKKQSNRCTEWSNATVLINYEISPCTQIFETLTNTFFADSHRGHTINQKSKSAQSRRLMTCTQMRESLQTKSPEAALSSAQSLTFLLLAQEANISDRKHPLPSALDLRISVNKKRWVFLTHPARTVSPRKIYIKQIYP